jgi:hypothetical protein
VTSPGSPPPPKPGWWAVISQNQVSSAVVAGLILAAFFAIVHGIAGSSNSAPPPHFQQPPASASSRPSPQGSVTPTTSITPAQSPSPAPAATFQTVPLGVLCNEDGVQTDNFETSCTVNNGSIPVGSNLFTWAFTLSISGIQQHAVLNFPRTTCRSLKLHFAYNNQMQNSFPGITFTVAVLQTSGRPVQATVGNGYVRSLKAQLNGGPWTIQVSADQPGSGLELYMNGSAVCSTSTGEP